MTKRYTPEPPDDEKRRATRRSEADLVSAWDNYAAAIDAGKQTRLVNLLRGHRPLEDADRTILADYIATFPGGRDLLRAPSLGEQDFDLLAHFIVAVNRGRGRCRDEDVRAVARTAEALKPLARGVAEALKPRRTKMRHRAGDRSSGSRSRSRILCPSRVPDNEREVLRDKVRSRLNRPLACRY
jgi:hypothetical protein